jgi:hypothetical protein
MGEHMTGHNQSSKSYLLEEQRPTAHSISVTMKSDT